MEFASRKRYIFSFFLKVTIYQRRTVTRPVSSNRHDCQMSYCPAY